MFQCRPQKWECSPKAAMPWRTSATTRARIWASPAPCPEVMYCNILYIDQINLPQEEVVLKLIYCPLQHLSSSILRSSDDQSKDWFTKQGSRRGRGALKCPLSIKLKRAQIVVQSSSAKIMRMLVCCSTIDLIDLPVPRMTPTVRQMDRSYKVRIKQFATSPPTDSTETKKKMISPLTVMTVMTQCSGSPRPRVTWLLNNVSLAAKFSEDAESSGDEAGTVRQRPPAFILLSGWSVLGWAAALHPRG